MGLGEEKPRGGQQGSLSPDFPLSVPYPYPLQSFLASSISPRDGID